MSDVADQRFAPPQAHVEDLATGEMVLAGRGVRLVASIVDGLIGAAVAWAVFMIPAMRPLMTGEAGFWSFKPASLALGIVLFLLIQGWPLVTRGQTLGKMLFKLRIVRPDGSMPEPWRLLGLRYGIGVLMNINAGISMIYALVDSLLIFRGSRKCLHDTIADTKVIKL